MTNWDPLALAYCLNAVWLVPVVAGAAWMLVKLAGLEPAGEHRVWLGALAVCIALPAAGMRAPSRKSVASAPRLRAAAQPAPAPAHEAVARVGSAAAEPAVADSTRPVGPVFEESSRSHWPLHEVRVAPLVARWFAWMYGAIVGFAAFRMARSWSAARRLVRQAKPYVGNDAVDALLRELAAHFGVAVPRMMEADRVRSPIVFGLWRPVLMLPAGFDRHSEAQRRAALCHEMAHLRRRDCLVHGLVQGLMLPLVWHPAIHLVARRIARTREMASDGMAARAMEPGGGELLYARCLLHLAQTMVRPEFEVWAGAGLGLFRTNKLEERMMRLTEAKRIFTVREMLVRRVGAVAVAGVVLIAGMVAHVEPVVAQESVQAAAPAPPVAVPPVATAPEAASSAPPEGSAPQTPEKPGTVPAPRPLPAAAVSLAPVASGGDGRSSGLGVGGADSHLPGGIPQNDDVEHVMVKDGSHVHRWVGADGSNYEVRDEQAARYTKDQERAAEAEYKGRIAQAQADMAKFKVQMDGLSSKASADAMAKAQAMLAQSNANFNSPEFKAHLDAQMKTLQAQLAHLDGKLSPERLDALTATLEAKLADAERQAALVDTPAMQRKLDEAAKRLDEASARLDAATKALDQAQKRLEPQ